MRSNRPDDLQFRTGSGPDYFWGSAAGRQPNKLQVQLNELPLPGFRSKNWLKTFLVICTCAFAAYD